jgi:hypothetical protein
MTNADQAGPAGQHFDAKGKLPSTYTIDFQKALRRSLPFEDQRDFEEAQRGFLSAPDYKQIMAEAGNVAWDMGSYEFRCVVLTAFLTAFTRLCSARPF